MTEYKLAITTCPVQESRDLAKTIIESKKAACVNVVDGIFSTYHWKGDVETAEESILLMKTTGELVQDLQSIVESAHPYDVPEFVTFAIENGAKSYLDWIGRVVE